MTHARFAFTNASKRCAFGYNVHDVHVSRVQVGRRSQRKLNRQPLHLAWMANEIALILVVTSALDMICAALKSGLFQDRMLI